MSRKRLILIACCLTKTINFTGILGVNEAGRARGRCGVNMGVRLIESANATPKRLRMIKNKCCTSLIKNSSTYAEPYPTLVKIDHFFWRFQGMDAAFFHEVSPQARTYQDSTYLQEAIQCCQHNSHGELIWVDEVECLGHCNKHLIINTVRHALLLHPLCHCQVILRKGWVRGKMVCGVHTSISKAVPHLGGYKETSGHNTRAGTQQSIHAPDRRRLGEDISITLF